MNPGTSSRPDEPDLPNSPLPTPHSEFPNPHSAIRILVVDDEPHVRQVLSRWLAAEGFECAQAANGEEAWGVLQTGDFALLIADIVMPGISGMTLLAKTRKQLPDVAVVMVTAETDREMAIRALQIGAYGYLIKPFDQNEVLINVANALERRRLTLATEEYERHLEKKVSERTTEIRQREEEIALRLVSASEFRDEETGAHIRRIGQYAAILAQAIGWDSRVAADMRVAAPMHDIGKIGVPDSILLKPAKLTSDEFEIVKKHTEIGAGILDGSHIPLLRLAKDIALSHHEKWDSSGYPRGLAGEAIPGPARIVAIADVYDALVTKRVYRRALPEEEALGIMAGEKGKHFDPKLFECFLRVLAEFRQIRAQVRAEASDASALREMASHVRTIKAE